MKCSKMGSSGRPCPCVSGLPAEVILWQTAQGTSRSLAKKTSRRPTNNPDPFNTCLKIPAMGVQGKHRTGERGFLTGGLL